MIDRSIEAQISALSKDPRLITVLEALCTKWGKHAFDIVDHWEANLHGVGVARRDDHSCLVYIDTFGKADGAFGVEFEEAPSAGSDLPYTFVGRQQPASFEELSLLVGQHLRLLS